MLAPDPMNPTLVVDGCRSCISRERGPNSAIPARALTCSRPPQNRSDGSSKYSQPIRGAGICDRCSGVFNIAFLLLPTPFFIFPLVFFTQFPRENCLVIGDREMPPP